MTSSEDALVESPVVPQDEGYATPRTTDRTAHVGTPQAQATDAPRHLRAVEIEPEIEDDPADDKPKAWFTTDVRGSSFWYLSKFGTKVFNNQFAVNTILFGNSYRMIRMALDEIEPGMHVMQPAAVYGSFSRALAKKIGPTGKLEITDIAPIQVALTRRKMADFPFATVEQLDAQTPNRGPYDVVSSFMLLHEVPRKMKKTIMAAYLSSVKVGGKVVVVEYGRPVLWHPLNMLMKLVFDYLEPFAEEVWHEEVWDWAPEEARKRFTWRKTSIFGGMYQKVVATRIA